MSVFHGTSRFKLQVEELLETIGRNNASKVMVGGMLCCAPVTVIIELICLMVCLGVFFECDGPLEQGC